MGPRLFEKADPEGQIWTKRAEIVGAMIDDARAANSAPDMELLLWQTAMGFWEVQRGHSIDGLRYIEPALHSWKSMLGANTWVTYVEQIKACADAQLALHESPVSPDKLRSAVATLEDGAPIFVGRRSGDPVHRLVLETLCAAYGTDGLNLLDRYQRTRPLLDSVRDGIKPASPGPTIDAAQPKK
jgi:hypothetical protein